jgi:predicted metalloprotease with PDZ domain
MHRRIAVTAVLGLFIAQIAPAYADNPMGYRLLSQQETDGLPQNHGALGMDVERAQQITEAGMTFDIMRIKQVRPGSAGERAGFGHGDSIIAVDGRVFPNIATFAAYVGSRRPGDSINVDYIPAGGGPAQAQRIAVVVGAAGHAMAQQRQAPADNTPTGMSTGAKVAIGVGAAALLGCYEMGCFSHRENNTSPVPGTPPSQMQNWNRSQPR